MHSKRKRKRILGAAATLTLLGLIPTVAMATQDDDNGGRLSGSLEAGSGNTWYAGGKFRISNTSKKPVATWKLEFDVTGGKFENHSAWNTTAVQSGSHVKLTPKEGHPLRPSGTQDVLWGISGQGTSGLRITNCSLDGSTVKRCGRDAHAPEPKESGTYTPSPPAKAPVPPRQGGSTPPRDSGVGQGPAGFSVRAASKTDGATRLRLLQLTWAAPGGSDAMRRYEVYVDDRLASTVYTSAKRGKVAQTLPVGPSPVRTMKIKVRAQQNDGRWSAFSSVQTVAVP
ncbi:cellulose binding domain-containing protein [Streptomyces melanogenes]|uniref:cellulose binding domain-containing protein n=1 Tax=Streptomyces melanogenes TaxID=67326 RepID=UPI00167C5C0E|nr:cellulose binding domain-containing protein [Streptomyces melanogenes]GGP85867.1 hypothetical protein GCM10010278_75380 [Streptomyces melanogenes]